jgi:glycosyltransferase involved in cell wall biosynthesis
MKIFLPFKIKGIGGTATFAAKFKGGMEARGHQVFFEEPEDYDVLFLNVQAPFRYLFDAKKKGKKIVQRLDGTYYWSVAGWKYPLFNLKARIIRHFFADFTVYQSHYSKYCAEKFLGKKRKDPSEIICNGVDLDIFSPQGEKQDVRDNPDQKIFFTASAFRREDQITPILEALEVYKSKYTDNFKFLVAGTFSPKISHIPEKWAYFKNIQFIGKIENSDLPTYERAADVFLFTHLNPPCPNNVIEALACGLPICGVADGAMPELIKSKENGLLIAAQGDAFWKGRQYDADSFSDNLDNIMKGKVFCNRESRYDVENRFALDQMINNYISILSQLITKNI